MSSLKDIKVVYISGYGRSGSTLLSMLLNTVDGVANIGEVDNLYSIDKNALPSLWKNLRENYETDKPDYKKRFSSLSWYFKINQGYELFKAYWTDLLKTFSNNTNCFVLVDASKSTFKTFCRPFYYRKSDARLKIIHLVRNPTDVASSFASGRNESNSAELSKPKKGGAYRALINWFIVNTSTSLVYKQKFKDFYVLNYDQFILDYEAEIAKLFQFLELDLPTKLLNRNFIELSEDLSFSGNRVRLKKSISIQSHASKRLNGFSQILANGFDRAYKIVEHGYK